MTKSFAMVVAFFAFSMMTSVALGQANSTKPSEGKKTGGIVGDPSHKRGFDLGYDAGPRAGNEDKAQNKTQGYSQRPEYLKPDQYYRYEYGSRAMFIAGYRRGFLRGYNSAFAPHTRKTRIEPARSRQPDLKKNTISKERTIAGDAW